MIEPIVMIDIGFGPRLQMLSIGDDVIAESYRTAPRSFEPASLSLWYHLASNAEYAVDVGAFTGIYSLVAASATHQIKVVAVEPAKHTFARLCLNVQLNGFQDLIAPLNIAAGDRVAELLLNHYDGIYCLGSGSTLMPHSGARPFWYSEIARILPLDTLPAIAACDKRFTVIDLPQRGPNIVKIDVEGYELSVLSGMLQTIIDAHPIFIIECLSKEALRATHCYLERFTYSALLIDDGKSVLYNDFDLYSSDTRNVLFFPSGKRMLVDEARENSGLTA